jgi:hypothetical protein
MKSARKNVTLRLPDSVLRRFQVYAASRNQSMNSLMTLAMERMMDDDGEYERAKKRFIDGMRNAPDIGLHGKISWTRDELHER